MTDWGWGLPPGCTDRDVDDAMDPEGEEQDRPEWMEKDKKEG